MSSSSPISVEPLTSLRASESRGRTYEGYAPQQPPRDRYWLHLLLFLLTLVSTAYSGGVFAGRALYYEDLEAWWFVPDGLRFALSLLLFLTVHEFGHYFAARYHRVSTSLPYYIPAPLIGFGTLGAVIRIREPIPNIRKLFDIGAAGPLAGFVVALGLLLYALFTLPPPSYIMGLPGHEELKLFIEQYGRFPEQMLDATPSDEGMNLVIGQTLLYWILSQVFPNVPPMYEMFHYPVLFAGWLGLFFTALNLLPVGQLDGGHILYALLGPAWHTRFARAFVMLLLISGGIGFVDDIVPSLYEYHEVAGEMSWFILAGILYFYLYRVFRGEHRFIAPALLGVVGVVVLAQYIGPAAMQFGYTGWLFFALLIVFLIKVDHPPVIHMQPLTTGRKVLAVVNIVIFVLCFSIRPIHIF